MTQVGIRELKAQLSGWLRRVHAEGETVAITDRGRVVAVLAPAPPQAECVLPSLHDRIAARGGRPASQSGWPADLAPLPEAMRALDAAALLSELRGDR
ncbi:MAG: type II toxin-antitoxin system Phd/YefM family antitoxin [Myxococcota bacterium]